MGQVSFDNTLGNLLFGRCKDGFGHMLWPRRSGSFHFLLRNLAASVSLSTWGFSVGFALLHSVDALKNLDSNCSEWEKLAEKGEVIVFPCPVRDIEAQLKVKRRTPLFLRREEPSRLIVEWSTDILILSYASVAANCRALRIIWMYRCSPGRAASGVLEF